jgi:membrane-associated protease RseP (regulator of RpoE activity)
MSKDSDVKELKEATGITDFSKLNEEQNSQIFKMIYRGQLSPVQLAILAELAPPVINMFTATMVEIVKQVENAGKAQVASIEVLKALAQTVEGQKEAILACKTDKCRITISENIRKATFKISSAIVAINKENNSFWREFWKEGGRKAAKTAGITLLTLLVLLFSTKEEDSQKKK